MDKQQRRNEIETLARKNEWRFSPMADISAIPALRKFEFHTGEKRKVEKVENLIEGANFKVFDVFWQSGLDYTDMVAAMYRKDSTARQIREQTIFCLESADLQLPKFHVYPTNTLNFIDKWLDKTFHRLDFSAYPKFAKHYSVRSESRQYFNENVIKFYEKADEFWTFATGSLIFIYQPNVLTQPTEILDWIEVVFTLSNLLRGKNL